MLKVVPSAEAGVVSGSGVMRVARVVDFTAYREARRAPQTPALPAQWAEIAVAAEFLALITRHIADATGDVHVLKVSEVVGALRDAVRARAR